MLPMMMMLMLMLMLPHDITKNKEHVSKIEFQKNNNAKFLNLDISLFAYNKDEHNHFSLR
jgi:hypothetical protein